MTDRHRKQNEWSNPYFDRTSAHSERLGVSRGLSCYRAHDTIDFAIRLGLVPCFTPVRSPQSNGMVEALVKTFKRDYVHVRERPDARMVLAQLLAWFEEYTEIHPHKSLRLKSPREFIRIYQPATYPV